MSVEGHKHTEGVIPLLDLPLGQRVGRVARNSVALALLGIPLYLAAIFGGRFQRTQGTVSDVWLLAAVYPMGMMLSATVGAALGRLWRNRWTAAVAVGVSIIPLFALISLAVNHSDPTTPYRVDWSETLSCTGIFVVMTPVMYDHWVRRFQAIQRHRRGDRDAPSNVGGR